MQKIMKQDRTITLILQEREPSENWFIKYGTHGTFDN